MNFQEIAKGLTIRSGKDLLEFERNLMLLVIQLGGLIIGWVLKARIGERNFQKEASRKVLRGKAQRYTNHKILSTSIMTLFGNKVKVEAPYYIRQRLKKRGRKKLKRGKNGSGICPALEYLRIKNRTTPALRSEIAREVTEGPSMESAQQRLSRRGINLNIKTVQTISERFAEVSLEIREKWLKGDDKSGKLLIPERESLRGMKVLIGVDGGRLRTRLTKRGRIAAGKKKHGYHTDWREPKMLTIRAIDEKGKVIRDVRPIYDGTIGNADSIFELLAKHLETRDIQLASEIVCVGDGAPWLWERMEKMMKNLGVSQDKISYAVDFYHAIEHLATVIEERKGWPQKKRKRWLKKLRKMVKSGRIDEVIEELSKLVRGRNAKDVKKHINYFRTHKERMRYDILAERGLPIGSGAVESCIRQVVNMRLKGTGIFWIKKNAEGFLHLNCYLKAGRWDVIEQAVIA
jgi:hypothetical protein